MSTESFKPRRLPTWYSNDQRQRSLMRCPDCGRDGVQIRSNSGGDFYGCRHCEFFAYTGGHDGADVRARVRLDRLNPDHPLRPDERPPGGSTDTHKEHQ